MLVEDILSAEEDQLHSYSINVEVEEGGLGGDRKPPANHGK